MKSLVSKPEILMAMCPPKPTSLKPIAYKHYEPFCGTDVYFYAVVINRYVIEDYELYEGYLETPQWNEISLHSTMGKHHISEKGLRTVFEYGSKYRNAFKNGYTYLFINEKDRDEFIKKITKKYIKERIEWTCKQAAHWMKRLTKLQQLEKCLELKSQHIN